MRVLKILLLSISLIFSGIQLKAQDGETEKKTPDFNLVVKKLTDGSFELKTRLSLFEKKKDYPISAAIVNFSIGSSDSLLKIEGNTTDKDGYAIAYLKPGVKIPKNKDGVVTANAEFSGNKDFEAASAEAIFTEAKINITCELIDTIKTVKVEVFKIGSDGKELPLSGESVIVSVQRMFSRLPIGEVSLDDEGKGSIEFPVNLPGDSIGNLQVVAFITEHEVYGNIESSTLVKWGVPKQQVLLTHRALWTQIAPLWMIVSLTILLIGVWAHYLYVIAQLISIKIKGKKSIVE